MRDMKYPHATDACVCQHSRTPETKDGNHCRGRGLNLWKWMIHYRMTIHFDCALLNKDSSLRVFRVSLEFSAWLESRYFQPTTAFWTSQTFGGNTLFSNIWNTKRSYWRVLKGIKKMASRQGTSDVSSSGLWCFGGSILHSRKSDRSQSSNISTITSFSAYTRETFFCWRRVWARGNLLTPLECKTTSIHWALACTQQHLLALGYYAGWYSAIRNYKVCISYRLDFRNRVGWYNPASLFCLIIL